MIETAPITVAPPVSASTAPVVIAPPKEDPWTAFSAFVLEAARAVEAAADGRPHDPQWDCGDERKTDIRATSPEEMDKLRAKGDPQFLLAVLGEIGLEAQIAKDGRAPSEEPSPNPDEDDDESETDERKDSRVSVSASAAVFGDGRVRWLAVRGYATSGRTEARSRIKTLPVPLRGALGELVTVLSAPSCALPMLTPGDLAGMPIPDKERAQANESLIREAEKLKKVCALAARADGAWDAKLSRLQVAYALKDEIAQLRADVRMRQGKICLGRVEASLRD